MKPKILRTQLSCGARFVGVPWRDGKESITVAIATPQGSIHDRLGDRALPGISHFLEHMLFESEENGLKVQMDEELEYVDGGTNAATGRETTEITATAPISHADLAFRAVTELATTRPLFNESELDREREAIFREMASARDSPESRLEDLAPRALFKKPHANSVFGRRSVLNQISPEDITKLWEQSYFLGNFTVFCVGPRDFGRYIADCEGYFARVSHKGGEASQATPAERNGHEDRFVRIRGLEQAYVACTAIAPTPSDPDYPALLLLDSALTRGSNTSILWKNLRRRNGLVYSVSGELDEGSSFGCYTISVGVHPKRVGEVRDLVLGGIKEATNLPQEEFEKQKRKLIASLQKRFRESGEEVVSSLIDAEYSGLSIEGYLGVAERVRSVQKDDLTRVAERLGRPVLVVLTPYKIPKQTS